MSELLARRNTSAVEQALKALTATVEAQQIRIDGLMHTNSTLAARVDAMELMVRTHQAKAMGTGPSVK